MKTNHKIIYWVPRIICILAILFVSMFAADVFESRLPFWKLLLGLFMHLIPSFILAAVLVIAWKWELVGGIILTAVALGFTPGIFVMNYRMNHSFWMSLSVIALITFPFILSGVLFILGHYIKKKQKAGGD
jgi:hypothetical protein